MNHVAWIGPLKMLAGMVAIGIALSVDLRSLSLEITRIRQGKGPSGIPLIAIPLYVFGAWTMPLFVAGIHRGIILLVFLVLHFSCHFVIPFIFRTVFRDSRELPSRKH